MASQQRGLFVSGTCNIFQKVLRFSAGTFFILILINQSMLKRDRRAQNLYGINLINCVLSSISCRQIQVLEDTARSDLQEGKVMSFHNGDLSISSRQLFCACKSVSSFQQKASVKKKAVSLYGSVLALARPFLPQLKATFIRAFDVKHGKPNGNWKLTQRT
jgi:hypothetical protein